VSDLYGASPADVAYARGMDERQPDGIHAAEAYAHSIGEHPGLLSPGGVYIWDMGA
jgi:hypothetical protein